MYFARTEGGRGGEEGKANKSYSLLHGEKFCRKTTNKNPFQFLLTLLTMHFHCPRGASTINSGCGKARAAQFKRPLKETTICLIISTKSIYLKMLFLRIQTM